eukprot:c19155_g1_i2 orf=683-1579(+)
MEKLVLWHFKILDPRSVQRKILDVTSTASSCWVILKPVVVGTAARPVFKSPLCHSWMAGTNQRVSTTVRLHRPWNTAWEDRSAHLHHGKNLAWLLFGALACFASVTGVTVSSIACRNLVHMEVLVGQQSPTLVKRDSNIVKASHGKELCTDFTVTGIPGDGRCLFRAVAYGACLKRGEVAPSPELQQELADELRQKVVDELTKRRSESEWFIEGDFDTYIKRMRQPHVWGGEPELLMASHVLKMPITVYMHEESSKGLISIAEYGQEYGKENPINVLYHGFGHYDALQIPANRPYSKL